MDQKTIWRNEAREFTKIKDTLPTPDQGCSEGNKQDKHQIPKSLQLSHFLFQLQKTKDESKPWKKPMGDS